MLSHQKILVVDDSPGVLDVVRDCLSDAGYSVITQTYGSGVPDLVESERIGLVIVDLGLPDVDGLSLVRELKARSNVGVIILSGLSETTDRIIGLEVGADDYVGKPFEPRELLARVRSVFRRLRDTGDTSDVTVTAYSFDGWQMLPATMELIAPDGEKVELLSSEYSILQTLVEHPNRILTRSQILDYSHSKETNAFDRSIDVQKIGNGARVRIDDSGGGAQAFDPALIVQDRQRAFGRRGALIAKEVPVELYRGATVDLLQHGPDRTGDKPGRAHRLPSALDRDRVH